MPKQIPFVALPGMTIWLAHALGLFARLAELPDRVRWMWSLLPWGRR